MSVNDTVRILDAVGFIASAAEYWGVYYDARDRLELRHRFTRFVTQEGNPDIVELVVLRALHAQHGAFSLTWINPWNFDIARREVVGDLPDDSAEAWNLALWVEHAFYADTDLFGPADKLLMRWTDAEHAFDSAEAEKAKRQLRAMIAEGELGGLGV